MPWDFILIFAILAVVIPWRGYARMKELLAMPAVSSRQRILLYVSTIAFQWALAGFVFWRARARNLTVAELGFSPHATTIGVLAGALIGASLLAWLNWANLRRMGKADPKRTARLRAVGARIFPQSRHELILFLALATTAGVCEEFLYRGFSMAAFARLELPTWVVVFVSSLLFGLAHSYQGRGGILGTLVLGTVFAGARIVYDSLIPVMVWHAAIDIAAGIAGPKYLLNAPAPAMLEETPV